jgi:hypothetical protein
MGRCHGQVTYTRTNPLAARIPEQGIGRAQVQGAGGAAETVAVPASALRLFLNLLTEMSQGKGTLSRSSLPMRNGPWLPPSLQKGQVAGTVSRLKMAHDIDPSCPRGLGQRRDAEEQPAVDRDGDPLPRTHADK